MDIPYIEQSACPWIVLPRSAWEVRQTPSAPRLQFPDECDEVAVLDGLHQVAVEPGRFGTVSVLLLPPSGERNEDDPVSRVVFTQTSARVVAAEAGQSDVEESLMPRALSCSRTAWTK